MGAYSTRRITRSTARKLALERVLTASDDLLRRIMDELLEERLYNCQIVDDNEYNDEKELGL